MQETAAHNVLQEVVKGDTIIQREESLREQTCVEQTAIFNGIACSEPPLASQEAAAREH
jgi:hypothetical protein